MAMTENGVSTTLTPGQEQHEEFEHRGEPRVQYDFRAADGKLFSCVGRSLDDCRRKRDAWLDTRAPN
jgi:hypothetical protein